MLEVITILILKNIKNIFLAVLLTKLCVLMTNLASHLFVTEEKLLVTSLLKQFLKKMDITKKVIKQHFTKNLDMSVEDERIFKSSNKCNKLFLAGDNKVRDHDHVTGKYRDSAHWNCNINLKLTNKISVIFHNLKGYDSHLIMQEIGKLDVKINFIPNGLEKYRDFTINNFTIDSMQFMNSSLDALVYNLSDNDFKHLSHEFSGEFSKTKRSVSI